MIEPKQRSRLQLVLYAVQCLEMIIQALALP